MFNLKTTAIYQAVRQEKNPFFSGAAFLKNFFFWLSVIFALVFFFGIMTAELSEGLLKKAMGAAIISLVISLFFLEVSLFYKSKIKLPKTRYPLAEALHQPEDFNLASFLDFEAAKICWQAVRAAKSRRFKEISQELLLFFLLKSKNKEINFVFGRAGLLRSEIKTALKEMLNRTPEPESVFGFERIILEAAKIAEERGKEQIGIGDILVAFAFFDDFFQKFLNLNNLSKDDFKHLVFWYERVEKKFWESRRFWEYENLLKRGSLARDWAAGYSITLDRYALDLREFVRKTGLREIVGHQREIGRCEQILEKQEINNVLLVGEPGTGRESIVLAIAQRAFCGKSSPTINHKRVLEFDLGQLAASTSSFEELEKELEDCFSQVAQAGNIILVIKEIHNFLSPVIRPGTMDISGVLSRFLPLSSFQIIATTSYEGLHLILERRPAILNLFEKVEVTEISENETLELLENFLPFFEKKYKCFVNYKALREILRLSSRYLQDLPFPEKAIRLLDESMSWLVKFSKEKVLLPEHIRKVVSEKVEIPLDLMGEKEKEILLNLENLLHERIINQEEAVNEISSALRRARAEIQIRNGPLGSFLFLGPTGVGKTETSKAIAAVYFGSEKKMIRIDMSEFQTTKDIKRLIGGEEEKGILITAVRENPFSLVLLDELEKAHPNILNLFLQVLDEGWLTDGFGRKVDFKNTLIIATSNAGAEIIREDIQQDKKMDIIKENLLDYLFRARVFRPEFINRFDAVVVFKPLTKENLLGISKLLLQKVANILKDKGINFEITRELKEKIVELGYSPQFGAREMQRVIQDKIENVLAKAILDGRVKRGNTVRIDPSHFELIIGNS